MYDVWRSFIITATLLPYYTHLQYSRCSWGSRTYLPFLSTWWHSRIFVVVHTASALTFFVWRLASLIFSFLCDVLFPLSSVLCVTSCFPYLQFYVWRLVSLIFSILCDVLYPSSSVFMCNLFYSVRCVVYVDLFHVFMFKPCYMMFNSLM